MFSFLRKKPTAGPIGAPPVLLPQSAVDSAGEHSVLLAVEHYAGFMTTKARYSLSALHPAVGQALALNHFLGTVIEQGYAAYLADLAKGERDGSIVADCLAAIGMDGLARTHASALAWLMENPRAFEANGTPTGPWPAIEALDRTMSSTVEKQTYLQFKAWFLGLPGVTVLPDKDWREALQAVQAADPRNDLVRVQELEATLTDPVTVGLRLCLPLRAVDGSTALSRIRKLGIASRNHHPSDPKGLVYLASTAIGLFLGYRDALGFHLGLTDSAKTASPDQPLTEALRPSRVLFSTTPEQVQTAITHARDNGAAFAAITLLDRMGLGKEIEYLAYRAGVGPGVLPGDGWASYHLVAAKDQSDWYFFLNDMGALISAPDPQNIKPVQQIFAKDLEKLRRSAGPTLN